MHQSDPVSPDIYRRRRLAAVGLGAAGVIVVLILAFIVFKGGDDSTAEGTSGSGSLTSSAAASGASTTSKSEEPAVSTGPCPDTSIAVKASVERATYKVGDEPVFTIVITNISTQTCDREIGSDQQQMLVYSLDGTRRVWANTDCLPDPNPNVKTLQPGQQAVASVKWSGTTSAPNCEGERLPVEPGAYTVVGQLGTIQSDPEPFNIA